MLYILWDFLAREQGDSEYFLYFMFGAGLIGLLTACINMNKRIFFSSVCVNPAIAQQSRQCTNVHKAKQQETVKEPICDEKGAACRISKRRSEDASRVLGDSDVPPCLSDV